MKGEIKQPAVIGLGTVTASDKLENGLANEGDVQKDVDQLTLEDIREQIRYIEKAVTTKELIYISRVLRGLVSLRRKLNHNVLRGLVQGYFPNPSPQKTYFMEFLPEAMDTDCSSSPFRPKPGRNNSPLLPEVEVYLHLLLLIFLIDEHHHEEAIRDGVIDAIINHEQGHVTTKETLDLYSTREPFDQFHQRIRFCLGVHNQAVKAMRYPPKQYNKDIESAEERREREQQELESAKELSEEDFDGFP
ncbi:26S proteasome non-ATPase regulatory subunit 3 [Fasciola hepatica]|uniref:26S proteasome non-ATPase regulatory subunit 3 n=1 Tax=Fasciola hepatica TaxID=6192 RepID=A0A4E0RSX3_FASHE|nr:26S proteasome non-ATPase regulatory subunit 3 [Fasciola hepatica]